MKKRDKLYKVNRWNQPLFAQGVDREHQNIFDGMFSSSLNTDAPLSQKGMLSNFGNSGLDVQAPQLSKPSVSMPIDWGNKSAVNTQMQNNNQMIENLSSSDNNPFSQYSNSESKSSGNSGGAQAGVTAGLAILDNVKIGNTRRGLWDTADPLYHLAGGRESTVGNGISDAGIATFKAGAMSGNPWIMIAGGAMKGVGSLVNAAWGIKTDKERVQALNEGIDYNKNFTSNAADFDDVQGPKATVLNTKDVYEGGWFSGSKARKKNEELAARVRDARSWANRSVTNNIENLAKTQMDTLQRNYAAFGGPLNNNNNMGAINYGFMSDYFTAKNKTAETKNKIGGGNIFGSLQTAPFSTFALGGDMQTNGADFSNGLIHISAGGSHESNPYEGIQLGISRENGNPNLVEEGETVFDDYVFSKRIKPDARTKKKFHLGGNLDTTFADLSKKLEKESLERPNDPLSRAALKKQMHSLTEEQERQKEERQTQEAQEAFAQLPPEQQQAIMEQVAMEEQQAEQAAQQQQLSAEQQQQLAQQPDARQIQETQIQEPQMEEVQTAACGGKLNKFDKGGDMKRQMYKALGLYTDADFDKWRAEKKLDEIKDWENITKNEAFMAELAKVNPALGDAIAKGYDFGAFKPTASGNLTFDFKHGGWGLEDYNAWNGSTDAAWKEAVEKGLVKKGMNSEEIGKALSQTDAYKRGSNWLKADEGNRLAYLQQILNSQDAPQAARDYAAKYVDSNGWKKDAKRDYQTIFEDPNGTGVRNTHPGTYWKTPNEVLRESQAKNYEVAADGSIHEIIGDVPAEWKNVGSYKWQDAQTDYGNNYFTRPVANTGTTEVTTPTEEVEYEPVHRNEKLRYLGLAGPLVGLGMQAAGIGKPDYSGLDAAVSAASGAPAMAHYKPIGNYLHYNPMDIWYEQNRLNANSRATDRAITNNASPVGTKMAGLLANGYNNQIASGNLFRQALEYNDAQRQKVAEFNRGTDMFNSQAFNQTSITNAQLQNNHRNFQAQMQMDAARQKMASDAAWNQGIYGNVNALFKGFSDLGKENAQHNMIADMAADGLFGTMSDKQHIANTYLRRKSNKAAKGGKVSRKRGLTF